MIAVTTSGQRQDCKNRERERQIKRERERVQKKRVSIAAPGAERTGWNLLRGPGLLKPLRCLGM